MQDISPEYVILHLRTTAGLEVSFAEAVDLVPLVRAQRAALDALRAIDVATVRTPIRFDPREGYAP